MSLISKEQVHLALGQGILLVIKYGLIYLIILYGLYFTNNIREMASNGNQAAIAISEFQKKGWLPKFVNNEVPTHTDTK